MKKILLILITISVATIIFLGIVYIPHQEIVPTVVLNEDKTEHLLPDPVIEKVSSMTLDEKIGQMMIIGFANPFVDAHIKEMISKYHVGGVNLLKRNVTDVAQVTKLISELNTQNDSITDIPFMVATDQEGGLVSRFTFLSHRKTQTQLTTADSAYAEAYERGKELAGLGVTADFSPVVDYVTDTKSYLYARTFGTTTEATATLAEAMVRGYTDAGIQWTIKHFPGYGNITKDPHRNEAGFDDVDYYEKALDSFKRLLENRSDGAVMTAHVIISTIDQKPATFSSYFLKEMLRKQWNYQGVIMTDDLEMVSAGKGSVADLAVEAVQAGNDMIISTFTSAFHAQIHEALKKAVLDGRISEEGIDRSVERVLRYKGYK